MAAIRSVKRKEFGTKADDEGQAIDVTSPVTESSAVNDVIGGTGAVDEIARQGMIAEAAYYRAAARGFEPGAELDDWLAAESDIGQLLRTSIAP